jgi:hypothetical protein
MIASPDVGPDQVTELYFAGGHGGVGGGDTVEFPLSNYTLHWMVREMERRGIKLAINKKNLPEGSVDIEPHRKVQGKLFQVIQSITGRYVRPIESIKQCHPSVVERYRKHPEWRPEALEKIAAELEAPDEEWLRSADI